MDRLIENNVGIEWVYAQARSRILKERERLNNKLKKAQYFIIHHNIDRLTKEFPDYKAHSDYTQINLNELTIPDELIFIGVDKNKNRAIFSEYLFILSINRADCKSEMIGLFTYSIPFKSRRFYNNNDTNLKQMNFLDLANARWDPKYFYSVALLPPILPWTNQFDKILLDYFGKYIDVSEIHIIPYYSSAVLATDIFFEIQKDLKLFLDWAREKYGLKFGAEAHIDNTFKDDVTYRHNYGDYGGLLEKAFGYAAYIRFGKGNLKRLGETIGKANDRFHYLNDLKPDFTDAGQYDAIAARIGYFLDKNLLPSNENDVIITYTTSGYIGITDNLLFSARQAGIAGIIVVCLDQESHLYYSEKGVCSLYLSGFSESSRLDFYDEGWDKLMLAKQIAIWCFLKSGRNVIYIDGDIFIRKNFLEVLRFLCKNSLMAFQSDENRFVEYNGLDPKEIRYCAGFAYIKSSAQTISLYDPHLVDLDSYGDDQTYINKKINSLSLDVLQLPSNLFPNGSYWYRHSHHIYNDALLVHFNWDKPFFDEPKEIIMQYYGMYMNRSTLTAVKNRVPHENITKLRAPLIINNCPEGLGNKLLSLANSIEIAYKYGIKIGINWTEGRYPTGIFSRLLKVNIKKAGKWDGDLRVYEDILDFIDGSRSYFPKEWNEVNINENIYISTNIKLSELYMQKVLTEGDVSDINKFCEIDFINHEMIGKELTYEDFEKIKYSFKGSLSEARANIDNLLEYDKSEFHEKFNNTNIIVSDFKYNDRVPEYVRSIRPFGKLAEEIQMWLMHLPRPICGLHIRQTDFFHSKKYASDPKELYRKYLDILNLINIKYIYIASDSEEAISWFRTQSGISVWSLDIARSSGDDPLHAATNEPGFEASREALLEMGILAGCDYLIRPKWSSFSVISEYWGNFDSTKNIFYIE